MKYSLGYFLVAILSAATSNLAAQATRNDATPPLTRLVRVAPSVQLEVRDWGGHGPPLVFLAGSGNTAHVFDDFAPQFTDSFHVVAITRRGFGASSGALPPNNLDTLVFDIRSILDSLRFASVVLLGHSFAGEEMTRFAELNPTRCAGLIYMDAAYDRTRLLTILKAYPQPAPPPMRAADSASPAALRAAIARRSGVEWPESEILATSRFDASGRLVGNVTPDSVEGRVWEAIKAPRYDRVQCRSLGIYAGYESTVDFMPFYAQLDSTGRAEGDALFKPVKELAANSETAFRQSGRNEVVKLPRANHYVFLDRPTEVARAIRRFLASAP